MALNLLAIGGSSGFMWGNTSNEMSVANMN
jgi:hypothetical protein